MITRCRLERGSGRDAGTLELDVMQDLRGHLERFGMTGIDDEIGLLRPGEQQRRERYRRRGHPTAKGLHETPRRRVDQRVPATVVLDDEQRGQLPVASGDNPRLLLGRLTRHRHVHDRAREGTYQLPASKPSRPIRHQLRQRRCPVRERLNMAIAQPPGLVARSDSTSGARTTPAVAVPTAAPLTRFGPASAHGALPVQTTHWRSTLCSST